jgi:16S rRNA processing protein RimM
VPEDPLRRIAVGRITRAHGIRGEVSVMVLTEVSERFASDSALYLEDGRAMTVEEARPDRRWLLVKFRQVADRTAAEGLQGAYLFVDAADVANVPEGSYWPHQLEGCEVLTENGRPLGVITEVVLGVANDIWVSRSGEDEVLIPALKDVVVSVDIDNRRVVVREIPGLTSPE